MMVIIINILFSIFAVVFVTPILVLYYYGRKVRKGNVGRRAAVLDELGLPQSTRIIGFFHPYCNAGGGGERVLWTIISSIQGSTTTTDPAILSVVYTGDMEVTKHTIIEKVYSRFNIPLDPKLLHLVYLEGRGEWVDDDSWRWGFTLAGQSLGSVVLVLRGLGLRFGFGGGGGGGNEGLIPDFFVDTMGYAFVLPVVERVGRICVGAYVHYPTISSDMLKRVEKRKVSVMNSDTISGSWVLTGLKLIYYRFFMYYYSKSLHCSSFAMVNSSWTKLHIDSILRHSDFLLDFIHISLYPFLVLNNWINPGHGGTTRLPNTSKVQEGTTTSTGVVRPPLRGQLVYPPCDTRAMVGFPLEGREKIILSVAQFRPEKNHTLQITAYHRFLENCPSYRTSTKLVMIGGTRNQVDVDSVDRMKVLVGELGISDNVEFIVNASYPVVLSWLARSSLGLSTMVDEHFGINLVEYMAAGLLPIAHRSGGPLLDIVAPERIEDRRYMVGHLESDEEGFARAFESCFGYSEETERDCRVRVRRIAVSKFSEEKFLEGWEKSGWREFL